MGKMVFMGVLMIACLVKAASFEEARDAFRNNFTNPPPGLVSSGGYIYHIFDSFPGLDESETIMKDQLRSLKEYIGRPKEIVSPFDKSIAEVLTPMLHFRIPDCSVFTIERKYHDSNVRVVTAYEADPINNARDLANVNRPVKRTLSDWSDSLRKLYLAGDEEEQYKLLGKLGASRKVLSNLTGIKKLNGFVDYLTLNEALSNWKGDKATVVDCKKMLDLYPVHAQAWRILADSYATRGNSIGALDAELAASAVMPNVQRVRMRIEALSLAFNAEKWKQLSDLYEKLHANDLEFGGKAAFWKAVCGSMGKVSFGVGKTKVSDAGAFEKAKALFRPYKGKDVRRDLEMALSLLVKSIECDPSDATKWRYYAAALRAANKSREAALAYMEALTLNPGDDVAAVDLLLLYDKLGFPQLAEGDAWWQVIAGNDDSSTQKACDYLKRKFAEKIAGE